MTKIDPTDHHPETRVERLTEAQLLHGICSAPLCSWPIGGWCVTCRAKLCLDHLHDHRNQHAREALAPTQRGREETMMASEPMSDERLAEIRSMLDGFQYGTLTITSVTSEQAVEAYNAHHGARWAIQDLLADNERLRAREAALEAEREQAMAVIRAVAHVILPYTTPGEEAIGMIAGHTVEQARALLASK